MCHVLYKPEVISASVVAIGAFNPAIFTPDWLERNGLIGSDDANGMRAAENLVVTRQVTLLEAESFTLQVEQNKFTASCKGVLTPALRDLVIGIFELVSHTPIRALGQNFDTLFKFLDEASYHRVGDVLAPKSLWGNVYSADRFAIGLDKLIIKIQEGQRFEKFHSNNCRNIIVERGATSFPAINFTYNDHHELAENRADGRSQAEDAAEILRNEWETAWHDATQTFRQIIDLALAKE